MSSEAKVALVTGSSSGIGESTVKMLSKKGYKLAICGSRQEKVSRVAKECLELSPQKFQPLELVLDFSCPDNGEVAVKKTIEHFGKLDTLINNAGIFYIMKGHDAEAYEVYRKIMTVNLDATVKATNAAVEQLKKNKGNLIFVSSVASCRAFEMGYAYCASKAAMSMYAKCMAIDLAPDVRVNIVSPGPVVTPIFERIGLTDKMVTEMMSSNTLQNRVGYPDEIGETICFLLSDGASFINGHEMFVDGGCLLKSEANGLREV